MPTPTHTEEVPTGPPTPIALESIVIALGGSLGASLRYGIGHLVSNFELQSSIATACVNLIGSFLLGWLASRIDSPEAHPLLRPFLVVGVFGSFTTFSALAENQRALASTNGELAGLVFLGTSIAFGIGAFAIGFVAARSSR